MLDLSKNCADTYPLHGSYIFQSAKNGVGITLCDHDFEDAIMKHEASDQGWKGFLLQFHCYEPWKENAWEIENLEELVRLLEQGIVYELPEHFNASHCLLLVDFLKSASESSLAVTIEFVWGGV